MVKHAYGNKITAKTDIKCLLCRIDDGKATARKGLNKLDDSWVYINQIRYLVERCHPQRYRFVG